MSKLFFKVRGSGPVLVLLHGFPMNHQVWDDYANQLANDFTVYTPDLPGFGKSSLLSKPFSIADVASAVLAWMEENNLTEVTLLGHSLGGYVALAMVSKKPAWFNGLILFHSSAYADSAEKKESRTKTVKFIEENGVLAFTSNFIAPLFADAQHPAISAVKTITMQAEDEAVKGYTLAMRDRPDSTTVLRDFKKPILLLAGDRDPGIPLTIIMDQSRIGTGIQVEVLENTGHMGMFEKTTESLIVIKVFISKL